jgi:hypothetical protein
MMENVGASYDKVIQFEGNEFMAEADDHGDESEGSDDATADKVCWSTREDSR